MTPISRCHVVHPQFHPRSAENDTRKSGSDAGRPRPGRGSVLPPQTTRCIQKYLPLTPSLWNVGCSKPIFAAVEHISARRRPILQDDGPHWVGSFATTHQAPDLLTSRQDQLLPGESLSMNGALEVGTEGHGIAAGGLYPGTQGPEVGTRGVQSCWMGLACLGKGLSLSWKGLGGTDIRPQFESQGVELVSPGLEI